MGESAVAPSLSRFCSCLVRVQVSPGSEGRGEAEDRPFASPEKRGAAVFAPREAGQMYSALSFHSVQ